MKSLVAAELNRRLTILRTDGQDDGLSSVPRGFVPAAQRWTKKTDVSDGERIRDGQLSQSLTARFLVRADRMTRSVTAKDVIECENVRYEVVGVKEWGGRNVGVEFTATAQPDQRS